jgi:hypothetical protein
MTVRPAVWHVAGGTLLRSPERRGRADGSLAKVSRYLVSDLLILNLSQAYQPTSVVSMICCLVAFACRVLTSMSLPRGSLWLALLLPPLFFVPSYRLQAQDPTGVIEGSIRDSVSGLPIAGVKLSLFSGPQNPPVDGGLRMPRSHGSTESDALGSLRFEKLPAGEYQIYPKKLGYIDRHGYEPRPQEVTLKTGDASERVLLELVPTATISGRVLDEDNRPLPGVKVYAEAKLQSRIPAAEEGTAGYRLEYLAPGDYTLALRVPMEIRRKTSRRDPKTGEVWGYPNTQYYPGVDDDRAAATIPVRPGAHIDSFDLRLRRARLVTLRGRITDAGTRGPLIGGAVELTPETVPLADSTYARRRLANDGMFQFDLIKPGSYRLLVYRHGSEDSIPHMVPVFAGTEPVTELAIAAPEFQTIEGRVAIPEGKAGTRWPLLLRVLPDPVGGQSFELKADERGAFTLIPPGRWRILAEWGFAPPADLYVASIRFGEQDISNGPFTISEGGNPPITITLSDKAGRLTGRVVDDNYGSMKNALIAAKPAPGTVAARKLYTSEANQNGEFSVPSLPPGEYLVSAWPLGFTLREWIEAPDKGCSDRVAKVTVQAGQSASVQLKPCRY